MDWIPGVVFFAVILSNEKYHHLKVYQQPWMSFVCGLRTPARFLADYDHQRCYYSDKYLLPFH